MVISYVQMVLNLTRPENASHLKNTMSYEQTTIATILGNVNLLYLSNFLPNMADVSAP